VLLSGGLDHGEVNSLHGQIHPPARLQRKAKRRRATANGAVFLHPSSHGRHPFTNARKADIAAARLGYNY